MNDTDNKNNSQIVVLNPIPSGHNLAKTNRTLMAVIFFLMTVIVVVGFFLLPNGRHGGFRNMAASGSYNADLNTELSAEVNSLKGQVVSIVSGSIESKLRALEENIRLGAVSDSLGTIEDLKNEIKILQSYSPPVKKESATVANELIIQEVAELKHLIYLGLASCGFMLAAAAGIWIKSSNQLGNKNIFTRHLPKD